MVKIILKYKDVKASSSRNVEDKNLAETIERMCKDGVFKCELEYFRIESHEEEN